MPIGPVSPKDMGRAGRGTSSGGSYGKGVSKGRVAAKGVGTAKAKGPTQAQVKGIRNKIKSAAWDQMGKYAGPRTQEILNAAKAKDAIRFRGISKTPSPMRGTVGANERFGFGASSVRKAGKAIPGSKLSKGKDSITSNMQAKEGVKSGQLPKKSFSPTNSARQKPVPAKPSKTGPQTRKSVKKGK